MPMNKRLHQNEMQCVTDLAAIACSAASTGAVTAILRGGGRVGPVAAGGPSAVTRA
jgi:hypothetical protein